MFGDIKRVNAYPEKNEMKKIYLGTDKQVQPNDFYDFI